MMFSCLKNACCLRFWQDTHYPDVILSHRPEVVLDTSRMGQDVVVVKNGRRLCGTGAAVAVKSFLVCSSQIILAKVDFF